VRLHGGGQEVEVACIGEQPAVQGGIVGQRIDGPAPHVSDGRADDGEQGVLHLDRAELDGALRERALAQGLGQQHRPRTCRLCVGREILGPGHVGRRGVLVIEALLGHLEGARQAEDGVPRLYGHHPPRDEAATIADAVDLVHDGLVGVALAEEVAVQRVYVSIFRYSLCCRRERLPHDLSPEHRAPTEILALTPEQVHLDGLEAKQLDELGQDLSQATLPRGSVGQWTSSTGA
jgi:hypothetical protein